MSQILKDCKIWIGGFDVSGVSNRVSLLYEVDAIEDTNIGDDTHVAKGGGTKRFVLAYEGAWDNASSTRVSSWTKVAQANFNVLARTELKGYTADSGFGTFNLGSGAGAGMKPWAVPTSSFDADDSINWDVEFRAPNSITQTDLNPGDVIPDEQRLDNFESSVPPGQPFPEYGWMAVVSSISNNGVYDLGALTGIVDEDSDSAGFRGAGRAQNQILVGGPEVNVGNLDVANDNFKLWARATRVPVATTFQVGFVFRTNHTTTNHSGIDSFRCYVKDNGGSNVDVIVTKRLGNTQDFSETVGTVALAVAGELKFGVIVVGDEATVFTGEAETTLGTVDLTQGLNTDTANDSSHQKMGPIVWNNAIVNAIDNLTCETRVVTDANTFSRIGTTSVFGIGPTDGSAGEVGYFGQITHAKYRIRGQIGDLLRVAHSAQGASALVRGTILVNKTVTGNGNETAYQVGAAVAGQKVYATMQVPVFTQNTSVTVTIESDDNGDFSSATTQFTFDAVDSNTFEWATPLDGPITDEYWRAKWVVNSGSPDIHLVVILGIQ